MHNVQPTEKENNSHPQGHEVKDSKLTLQSSNHNPPFGEDKLGDDGKSFEDEDESSIRSDDWSRSDAPSDDKYETPSASLQNLLIIQAQSSTDGDFGPEIEDNITVIPRDYQDDVIVEGKRQFTPQTSVIETEDTKGPSNGNSMVQSQLEPSSPSASLSISVGSVTGFTSSELTQSTESNVSRESNSSSSGNNNVTTSIKEKEITLLQPGMYNSKPSKKKMWYHVFTPSYKTRSMDFRKYFKDLPLDERLIVDYSCALQKEILVQGRMFVSQNYLSFYANIFGWQTVMTIKFKDISSITKEHTALVIPNAVQVVTGGEKYFFTSYVNRDSTYIMLFKLWQTALLDQNLPPKEIWKLIHTCYGEVEIGSEEEECTEDYISLRSTGSLGKAPSVTTLISVSDGDDTKSLDIGPQVCSGELDFPSGILGPSVINSTGIVSSISNLANGIVNVELIPTDLSDSSDSEEEHAVEILSTTVPICPVPHEEGKTVVDVNIPCDVDTLFTMLFTNSKFYLDFHTMRKTFDILQQEWQEKDGRTTRQVSFTVTLNQRMGPKHSQITETQLLLPVSKPGCMYAVDIESNNAGIPYADAFYVTCHFCLSRVTQQESRLVIVAQLKYRKSIWGLTKSFIEKNCWSGIDEFYSSLEKSLKDECSNLGVSVSPPPSPRGKIAQIRRRPLRKKGPAPGIPTIVTGGNVNMPTIISAPTDVTGIFVEPALVQTDGSLVLKLILSVLAILLLLNAFLYMKLTKLEATSGSPMYFSPQPITFAKEMPQNHQEWLELLQQQEALHRFELQKWHDILVSALKILKQAEADLESLRFHVDSYGKARQLLEPSFTRSAEKLKTEGAIEPNHHTRSGGSGFELPLHGNA